jgi:uncharacterized protein (TIGR00369 family)
METAWSGTGASGIERVRQMVENTRGVAAPVMSLVGMAVTEVGAGSTIVEMDTSERHANPMGTLHGGILCDLGDLAMGFAMATTLSEGESFTTVELKVNYFKPVRRARLRATARIVRRSKSLGYLECDVVDEQNSLVARLGSTCMVLRGAAATGR